MTKLTELLTRWDAGDDKPFKGSLIDWRAYEADPDSLGCMCAQGQVLHQLGGWSPERIRDINGQAKADAEVAKLLNISRGHAVLLRNVNDSVDGAPSIVLTDPGKVLGGEWSKLLDFWWHIDQMTAKDWDAARDAARDVPTQAADRPVGAAQDAAQGAAWAAAQDAARDAAWDAARDAAWAAAGAAAWAAAGATAWAAAWEIQGAHIFRAANRPFYFLSLFGFASPDEIPARPANYGEQS